MLTIRRRWAQVLLAALLLAAAPAAAQTGLTLYNDGRVLVRRDFPIAIARGDGEYLLPLGLVDPGSVFPLDSGVTLVQGRYDAGVDYESVLRRAVGRRLTFRSGKDTVIAELVAVDPARYRLADGSITFVAPGTPQFPADLVTLEPGFRAAIRSDRARRALHLGYFTAGGGWSASYQVVLGGKQARVTGSAVVNSGPLRLDDVELQLLAGQVNRVAAAPSPRAEAMRVSAMAQEGFAVPAEQKVGEFHLYTLPGRHSLTPGIVPTVSLFDPATAPITRTFEVAGQLPWWGGLPQYGEEDEPPVSVIYTVGRARRTPLGERPLPGGLVRLFEPDSAGRVQLIGEAAIGHSPAGEDLRLEAGSAFDLTAKRVQTNYVTRRESAGGRSRTVATADYRVTITNAGETPERVDVIETRSGEWSVLSSSVPAEKLSSTRTRFRVSVPARGEAILTYSVRVIW